jgi:type IV pilus assembly protein PilA
VLVAISIPIFTSQLEKSREATDEANIRSIYAQLSADVLTETTISDNTNFFDT